MRIRRKDGIVGAFLAVFIIQNNTIMAWSSSSSSSSPKSAKSITSANTPTTIREPLLLNVRLNKSRLFMQRPSTTTSRRASSLLAANIPNGGAMSSNNDDTDEDDKSIQQQHDDDVTSSSLPIGRYRWSVLAILSSAFLNLLGFTMAGPITPALGQHFQLPVGASFGSLTSAYPLGMLGGLFVWPQLSDTIGRKPVLVLSLLGSGIGLGLQSHVIQSGGSLLLFLASRVATGCFAGSSPVSKAFLADVGAASGQLPRFLAWRDACSTLAFIVGPLLGGFALDAKVWKTTTAAAAATTTTTETISIASSLAFVIGISSAASLAAAFLIALLVKDVEPSLLSSQNNNNKRQQKKNSKFSSPMNKLRQRFGGTTTTTTNNDNNNNNKDEILSCPLGNDIWSGVLTVCLISFLFNVGDSTFHAFFSALLKHEPLNYPAKTIGLAYTIFACVSFGVSATIVSPAISKLGPVRVCSTGLAAVSMGLYGLAATAAVGARSATTTTLASSLVWPAAILYYAGVPLYGPTIPTMLLRCVPPNQRGRVMGLDGAINTLARIVSPLLMGYLYQTRGASVAFGMAGMATLSSAIIALARRIIVLWKQQQQEQHDEGSREEGQRRRRRVA